MTDFAYQLYLDRGDYAECVACGDPTYRSDMIGEVCEGCHEDD